MCSEAKTVAARGFVRITMRLAATVFKSRGHAARLWQPLERR